MLFSDTYKTIEGESQGLFKDRGSRFIALALPVTSGEEIKARLAELRKEYHDARHHCFAWVLDPTGRHGVSVTTVSLREPQEDQSLHRSMHVN